MLKITREIDQIEVKQLTTVIYAPPGTGKTSTVNEVQIALLKVAI